MKRIVFGLTLSTIVACLVGTGMARDLDGRYANSPLKSWFDHLASGKGLCCSMADGETVADPDRESKDGHYRVRLDNNWIDVPNDGNHTVSTAGQAVRRRLTGGRRGHCSAK